ncbi:hypothetical protein K504DRAFT_457316 [Pleomassaria siparia CBS 279.74]|uniref:Lipid droplet-associated hydrolase n=1 Tax=Pleomassaria siparia CBS 279.74 TaxID=1314801 RepID=A0A6G1KQN5_9PLEO|nr:hypothetical protein K504DRAFT_457316 [Pleomassaria siparia CBS 279.74]
MPLSSTIHLHPPISTSLNPTPITYIIYHITGNPGLVEYYRVFLTHLYGLLSDSSASSSPSRIFHVYGRSLSGFEVDGHDHARVLNGPPYSLEQQITESLSCLLDLVKDRGTKDVRVILMGHSVGSYILLEIIRRVREKAAGIRIVGGICLFPTVTHIAKSASGRKVTPLVALPAFPLLVSLLAKALTLLVPTSLLGLLIRIFMNFPPDAANVTASFVKSKHGVRQALYMTHDEMLTITDDVWDEEIWGAAKLSEKSDKRPVLRFLFAETDHWVANETRDELIRVRGSMQEDDEVWKPKMEIDFEYGWPHGFCIKHSVPVAERVCGYVEDIIRSDLEG